MIGAFVLEMARASPRRRKQEIRHVPLRGGRPERSVRPAPAVILPVGTIAAARYFAVNYDVVAG